MKDIENFPNYMITDDGRVYNKKWRKFTGFVSGHNGVQVCLYKNGKRKLYSVSRLVAEAFLEKPKNASYVRHKDRNSLNNEVTNIEWIERK
jgi:hypothetical protein